VPGLIVTQHSGEGKANQYFLRGFNLDHGTDLAITVDGTATTLDTGDCVTFGATQLHDWHNPTDGESEVLWAIVPPIPHEQFHIGFRGD